VRDAVDDERRVAALERLAELDMDERQDPASAVLSLHSILEVAPGHLPSLRARERYYLEQDRRDDLAAIEERLVSHLAAPEDVAVHLRFAARLRLSATDALGDAADGLILANVSRARRDGWLARRVSAAARAAGARELAAEMEADVASRMPTAIERASIAMRAAEIRALAEGGSAAAAEILASAVEAAPEHPIAAEALARLREAANDARGAAEALSIAARAARVGSRAASLWYRAGVLWQDTIGDEDRALEALTEASKIDVGYLDVFDRLRNVLEVREDAAALSALAARRLTAGGDPATLAELHSLQAKLKEKLGDKEGAKDSLRSVLALSPEKYDTLKRLAELSIEGQDYRTAVDPLIRIARTRKDPEELRWVFFTLGDIYDRHIPDPKRAETAFRRVLKDVPDDVECMERLAAIHRREKQHQAAAEQLEQLARIDPDPDRQRQHRLALAEVLEEMGDARQAEQVLDAARKSAPTDLAIIKALVEFHTRHRQQSALAMHLNRAVAEFRQAIVADLSDPSAWLGLIEVLRWRGRQDGARAIASAASALGITDPDVARLLDAGGGAPAAGAAAADGSLVELLAPPSLPAPARTVLHLVGTTLEKVIPFDPRAYRAEKLGPRDGSFRATAVEVARWFGIEDVEVWVTPSVPRVCVPVSSAAPVALLVGRDLLASDERERIFMIARALKIAREGLTIAVRTQPQELVLAMAGLVFGFDPNYKAPGLDPAQVQDWSRRIARQLPRRAADDLGPVVFEMSHSQDYDPARMPMAASELGDRVALIACGSAPAAFSALLKLSGEPGLGEGSRARLEQVRRHPEILSLATFAISDAHFEARHRAGADRG
jgi:tetratricopeptide (TPR) repeat protein